MSSDAERSWQSEEERWPCVESNPQVFTKFARWLGLSWNYKFVDCWSLDEEMIDSGFWYEETDLENDEIA